jgi:hypothetical protein
MFSLRACEHCPREEFTIPVFIAPGALDIKESQPGKPASLVSASA